MKGIEEGLKSIMNGVNSMNSALSKEMSSINSNYSKEDIEMIKKSLKDSDIENKMKELNVEYDNLYKFIKNKMG